VNRRSQLILLAAAALSLCCFASHAAENGWFGFTLAIDADGIFAPKLRSIKIEKVFAASPAAKSGLAPGDMIVEMEGIAVEGAKADTLKAAIEKSPGETLRLKIKRGAEAARDVSLVAVPKPAS
jgi:C-terminal processing protease CtpA/Prc